MPCPRVRSRYTSCALHQRRRRGTYLAQPGRAGYRSPEIFQAPSGAKHVSFTRAQTCVAPTALVCDRPKPTLLKRISGGSFSVAQAFLPVPQVAAASYARNEEAKDRVR